LTSDIPPNAKYNRGNTPMSGNVKSMTYKELESVIFEGRSFLEGRRILEFRDIPRTLTKSPEGAPAARHDRFLMLLESEEAYPRRIVRLLISLRPDLNYLLIASRPQPRPKKGAGSAFARRVHALVAGGRLLEAGLAGRDRIVSLRLESAEGRPLRMVAELFGRHPNLLLLDGEDVVTSAFKETATGRPLGADRSQGTSRSQGTRAIRTGAPYPPPPPSSGGRRAAARSIRFSPAGKAVLPDIALNTAADLYFKELDDRLHLEEYGAALKKRASRALRRVRGKIAATEKRLAAAREAETVREQGDLLKAHFHLLRRGMTEVEVPNILSGDPPRVVIPLDRTLDPAANLDALYKRYRKLARSLPPLREALEQYYREAAGLEAVARGLLDAATLEEAAAIGERLLSLVPQQGGAGRAAADSKPRRRTDAPGVRRFQAPDGQAILVGRDGETNHKLLQIARGLDLWLHCHGVPGAHVVIPLARGKTASLDTLLAAGLLAVHFSRLRGTDRADVIYTPRKYVRALKGGKKGLVVAERFKTLHVKTDPQRVRSLLASLES